MGVKKLGKYIEEYIKSHGCECQRRKSKVTYYDFTGKLISLYDKKYYGYNIMSEIIRDMSKDVYKSLSKFVNKGGNKVYAFIDRHFFSPISSDNIYLREFLPDEKYYDKYEDREYLHYDVYIPKEYVNSSVECIKNNLRCQFEIEDDLDFDNYVKLSPEMVLCDESDKEKEYKDIMYHGWYRFLIKRGSKYDTMTKRAKAYKHKDASIKFCDIMSNFGSIVEEIYEKHPEIRDKMMFLGCTTENDYAIESHIKRFQEKFPTVLTNDSDLLVNLCDVDCQLSLYRDGKTYYIQPKMFWRSLFGCDIDKNVIKIMCVSMGTDYNKAYSNNDFNVAAFDEWLNRMNVNRYHDIKFDCIMEYVSEYLSKCSHKCAYNISMSVNIYLNNFETRFFQY